MSEQAATPPESGTVQAPEPVKALPPASATSGASRNTAGAIAMRVHESVLREKRHWQTIAERLEPLPMLLFCPACGRQHVDAPDPERDWTNPPHRSHECADCGCIWRPADFPTTGIAAIRTQGKADTWSVEVEAVPARRAESDKWEEGR